MSWKNVFFSYHKGERQRLRSAAPELSWLGYNAAVESDQGIDHAVPPDSWALGA